jgi:hypothetical protein
MKINRGRTMKKLNIFFLIMFNSLLMFGKEKQIVFDKGNTLLFMNMKGKIIKRENVPKPIWNLPNTYKYKNGRVCFFSTDGNLYVYDFKQKKNKKIFNLVDKYYENRDDYLEDKRKFGELLILDIDFSIKEGKYVGCSNFEMYFWNPPKKTEEYINEQYEAHALFFYNEKTKKIKWGGGPDIFPYNPYLYSKKSWIIIDTPGGAFFYNEKLKELRNINKKITSEFGVAFFKLLDNKIILFTYKDLRTKKNVIFIYKSLFSISLKDFSLNVIKESFKKKISTKNLIFDITEDLKHLLILKNKREIYLFDIKSEDMKLLYKSQKDIRRVEFVR